MLPGYRRRRSTRRPSAACKNSFSLFVCQKQFQKLTPTAAADVRRRIQNPASSRQRLQDYSSSVRSSCSPEGRSAYFSRCSGHNGSEMACSPPNHLPRSTSLQRWEQNGAYFPANQSPDFLHVGHLVCDRRLTIGIKGGFPP